MPQFVTFSASDCINVQCDALPTRVDAALRFSTFDNLQDVSGGDVSELMRSYAAIGGHICSNDNRPHAIWQ